MQARIDAYDPTALQAKRKAYQDAQEAYERLEIGEATFGGTPAPTTAPASQPSAPQPAPEGQIIKNNIGQRFIKKGGKWQPL